MELNQILSEAIARGASDIHLKHGVMPVIRIHGRLTAISKDAPRLSGDEIAKMAQQIMTPEMRERFAKTHEVDMGYGVAGVGRFRVNIFQQRGSVGMVIRTISFKIKNFGELKLPKVLEQICTYERGLVLVTGVTGSGKSTTLASMIDYINGTRTSHILTIEDPIEYLIRDRKSIVNQRELGLDTASFGQALKAALRQDPDVILIGEMRDRETIDTSLLAAETGHLVFSTLHTADTTETINRILGAFEPHQQPLIRLQLAANLKAVVSQRLISRADGKGVVPAVEIMVVNTRIREMISDSRKTMDIPLAIEEGETYGMQSFDQSLMSLVSQGFITQKEALQAATNPHDFALRSKGVTSMDGKRWAGYDKTKATGGTPMPEDTFKIELHTMPKIPGERVAYDEEEDDSDDDEE